MPTTVMMTPPVRGGYPVRCPGTDGRKSHVFYMATKPNPHTTYYCSKCHPFLQLDRIARDVSRVLGEDSQPQEEPAPQRKMTEKSVEELLRDLN